ncbi:hypothetical protein [Pedobacter cryoconitis]|uniref:hypothetical protein n=1 Tax=Pedobacter cryoconitis TaxID=188932 RepID=UPI00160F2EFF|nr:hypothetical protein [Pedobacter cryoconitis]MBB5647657.1 hypothetical protein [Pedobacter cryoconitis]
METPINITLSEDFNTLCSIYQIKPEYFIQTFIDQVSFPSFYSRPSDKDRWATFFFLQFLEIEESHYDVNRELEEHYLSLFRKAIRCNFKDDPEDIPASVEAGRNMMNQWLKAVLAERAKYITDKL